MKTFFVILSLLSLSRIDNCAGFKDIFRQEKIISYLHTELKDRRTVYLVNNKFCTINEQINKLKIVTVDEKTAILHKNYLKITSITETAKGKIISLDYPIEGACFTIQYDENNKITQVNIIEK